MNKKLLVSLGIFAILAYHQVVNGQEWNTTQQEVNKTNIDNLTMQRNQLETEQQSLEIMVNYCFEHIDRPNPIQDLIEKGFVDSEYRNITCKDIKMTFDINQERITELQNKINEYWESPEGQQQQAKELESSQKLSCEEINGNWIDGKCFITR